MNCRASTEPSPAPQAPRRPVLLWVVGSLTLILAVGLVAGGWELALPAAGWSLRPQDYHPYAPTALLGPLLLGLLAAAALVAAARRPRPAATVGALALLTVVHLQAAILIDGGGARLPWAVNSLGTVLSDVSNGYFAAAERIGALRPWLADYHELQARDGYKLSTHPPGAVLAYWLPLRLYQQLPPVRALAGGWLDGLTGGETATLAEVLARIPTVQPSNADRLAAALWCLLWIAAAGSLTVWPVYLLGARWGGPRVGLAAAGLFCLLPSSLLYTASLDVVLLLLTAWALVALDWGLTSARGPWAGGLAAGLALGAALSASIGAAASVGLVVAYGLAQVWAGAVESRRLGLVLAALGGGLLVVALGALALGVRVPTVLANGLGAHQHGAGGTGHRPYWPWAVWNLVDYALLVGPPVVAVALAGWRQRAIAAPVVAVVGLLVLLSASGIVKAETERLWIFANPLLATAAAAAAAARADYRAVWGWQALWLAAVALSLPPLVRPY